MGKSLGRYTWHFNINLNERLGDAALGGLHGKEFAFNAGDLRSVTGSERGPGEGNGYSL